MKRLSIVVVALLIGAAAPARAWCEATCLAPVHHSESATPHCPTHEPSSDAPSITAALDADCPVIESARPATTKIELARSALWLVWDVAPRHPGVSGPRHVSIPVPLHLTNIPLRI